MRQTTLCVPFDVKPESGPRLAALLTELRREENAQEFDGLGNFSRLQTDLPAAHFLSMSVFGHGSYDPILVIEANFDGEPGPFWAQFERALGKRLRDIIRCCKRPDDGCGALHDAVTAEHSTVPIAPYLERRTQRPSVFHHGNRGMTRDRIRAEAALAEALEAELDGDPRYRAMAPAAIQAALRDRLLPRFPWLAEPAAETIGGRENLLDWVRLILFAAVVSAVLLLPGALTSVALGPQLHLAVAVLVGIAGTLALRREGGLEGLLPGKGAPPSGKTLLIGIAVAIVAAIAAALLATPVLYLLPAGALLALSLLGQAEPAGLWPLLGATFRASLWSLPLLLALLPGLAWLLRWNERRDSRQDAPPVNERTLAEIVRREDRIVQNHMASVVLIRPGVMRSVIIRAGHLGLHLVLRVLPHARRGYLGTMRTVHFAHWAFLNNTSRLLFVSNFDHSWDSYLDDFIEKAHGGLTLAWGCGIGFPATRWLVRGGAQDGRRFKTWALASRAVSRFWYSAYPTLTVDRIDRHREIAAGLRHPASDDKEAQRWLRLL